jgi:dipeptidyl aminopeptidase/acylaminoacyl peptidase
MRALVMLAFVAVPSAVLGLSTPSATANPADPNGQILFGRYDPNLDDTVLYTINPDGSHDRQVVPFAVECPHWSPDGSRIAACGTHSFGESSGATIIDPDTGSYRELPGPAEPELATACYVWSPDAKRLACESWSDSDPSRNGIYTIRTSDGQGLSQMTSNPFADDTPVDYAPNGKRLVFIRSDADGTQGLFVVKTDGRGLRQIAPAGVTCCNGDWSPQGNNIVFSRHVTPDVHSSMWIVHSDGTGLREVRRTRHTAAADRIPTRTQGAASTRAGHRTARRSSSGMEARTSAGTSAPSGRTAPGSIRSPTATRANPTRLRIGARTH